MSRCPSSGWTQQFGRGPIPGCFWFGGCVGSKIQVWLLGAPPGVGPGSLRVAGSPVLSGSRILVELRSGFYVPLEGLDSVVCVGPEFLFLFGAVALQMSSGWSPCVGSLKRHPRALTQIKIWPVFRLHPWSRPPALPCPRHSRNRSADVYTLQFVEELQDSVLDQVEPGVPKKCSQ